MLNALAPFPRGNVRISVVSAPVMGIHLIVPNGIHLQQRGLALANGVADIVTSRKVRMYVSNFSRDPVRLVKGMNIGTLRSISTKPLQPYDTEKEPLPLMGEGSSLGEGENVRVSPLFAEAVEEHKAHV